MVPPDSDPTAGELSRRMRDVLMQFEVLVRTVEERYVRKDVLDLYKETIHNNIASAILRVDQLDRDKCEKNDCAHNSKRLDDLEDQNKWLFRIVIGFVIVAVLTAAFASGNL